MKFRKLLIPLIMTTAVIAGTVGIAYATTSTVNGKTYTHPSWYTSSTYRVFHGIDVSYWNYTNNWTKIKKAGVDYAFIRLGYTSSNSFSMNTESKFATNVDNAYSNGVNVGIYYWSEATSTSEAAKEANYVVSVLKSRKYKVTMPVVMDYEFASGFRSTNKYNSLKSKYGSSYARKWATNNANAFLKVIKDAGYTPMFYSYRGLVDGGFSSSYHMNMSSIANNYKFWLAQYSSNNSYTGSFEYWQYTSSGSVSGIGSSRVDRNFWYYNNSAVPTTSGTKSMKDCSVSLAYTSTPYTGSRIEPSATVKDGSTTLTEGTDYVVMYFHNVKGGTSYAIVRGIGNYSNEVLKKFTISTKEITSSNTTISSISSRTYTGSSIKPSPTVKYGSTTLKKNTDYTLSYSKNTNVGTATVKITGKGNYYGTLSKTFKIVKSNPTITAKQSTYKMATNVSVIYIGGKTNGGALTYSSSDTALASVSSKGLIKSYSKTGTATITLKSAATSNVNAGSKTVTVKVYSRPQQVTATKITRPLKNYFRLYWNTTTITSGYLIKYSDTSTFKNRKYYWVTSDTTSAKTLKDSLSGHYVYAKVRAYRTLDGKRFYGKYSDVFKIKVR